MRAQGQASPFRSPRLPRPWSDPRAGASGAEDSTGPAGPGGPSSSRRTASLPLPERGGRLQPQSGRLQPQSGRGAAHPSARPLRPLRRTIGGGACRNPSLFRSLHRAKPAEWAAGLPPGPPPAPARLPRPSQHEARVVDRKSQTDPGGAGPVILDHAHSPRFPRIKTHTTDLSVWPFVT